MRGESDHMRHTTVSLVCSSSNGSYGGSCDFIENRPLPCTDAL